MMTITRNFYERKKKCCFGVGIDYSHWYKHSRLPDLQAQLASTMQSVGKVS